MTTGVDRKEWIAGRPLRPTGKLNRVGGKLVLDGDRLTFRPLLGLGVTKRFRIADIDSVEPVESTPPKLRLELSDGSSIVFMVVAKMTSSAWSKDASARDEAVATISALLRQP